MFVTKLKKSKSKCVFFEFINSKHGSRVVSTRFTKMDLRIKHLSKRINSHVTELETKLKDETAADRLRAPKNFLQKLIEDLRAALDDVQIDSEKNNTKLIEKAIKNLYDAEYVSSLLDDRLKVDI